MLCQHHACCMLSCFSCVRLSATLMDCSPPDASVHGILQARILEWLPCPPPEDLPNPGIKPFPLMSSALAGGFFTTCATWEPLPASTLNKNTKIISLVEWNELTFCEVFRLWATGFSMQCKLLCGIVRSWWLPFCTAFSLVTQTVKNPPAVQETWVSSLGLEVSLKQGMATHSSVLGLENHHRHRSLVHYSP